jgi:hypothetical protein
MAYVHFDREAVAAAVRKAANASFELALSAVPDEASRAYVRAQHRFTDSVAEAYAVCIDLKNAGTTEEMVASALGANLGVLVGMAIMNAENPGLCARRINAALQAAVESALGGDRSDFSSAPPAVVNGQPGGGGHDYEVSLQGPLGAPPESQGPRGESRDSHDRDPPGLRGGRS